MNPRYELQRAMRGAALQALADADAIVYLADATEGPPPPLVDAAELKIPPKAPTLLALNKTDRLSTAKLEALRAATPDAFFVSALTGDGVEPLLAAAGQLLPESPYLYPEDEISTQSMRFFVSELVRETALEQLQDEVPYSVACEIEEFREDRAPVYIRAVIYVERESQKGILIGAGGSRIREIGRAARAKIESLVGQTVYLDLRVKVLANWRRNARSMQRFGYRIAEGRSK
jgi:GTP-binding protein Era